MKRLTRKPLLLAAAVGVLLICVLMIWSPFRPTQEHSWKEVREGVTTEAEAEARFGPPASSRVSIVDRHLVNSWWYDDDHYMQLEIADTGVVVRVYGPCISPPRSPIRRWWRETAKPYLFE